jgi:hypothetical protein
MEEGATAVHNFCGAWPGQTGAAEATIIRTATPDTISVLLITQGGYPAVDYPHKTMGAVPMDRTHLGFMSR